MPPPSEGRAGNILIWLISGFFLTSILGGGFFLILYIALPASNNTSWFPVVGIVLIGIPWAFWIVLCIYRSLARNLSRSLADRPSFKAAAGALAGGSNSSGNGAESAVDSPGGARRVRFADEGGGGGGEAGHEGAEGSSGAYRESEKPLTHQCLSS